jgi:hypothetical protein
MKRTSSLSTFEAWNFGHGCVALAFLLRCQTRKPVGAIDGEVTRWLHQDMTMDTVQPCILWWIPLVGVTMIAA